MSLLEALASPFTSDGLLTESIWLFCMLILIGIGIDLVTGYTGMFQLGHIGFFALGALGTTFATTSWGLDMTGGILVGMVFASIAVLVIGIPTLRLSGDYFAIATFGFALSVQAVFIGFWASGIFGVPSMNPFGCDLDCMSQTWLGSVGRGVTTVLGLSEVPRPAQTGLELLLLFAIVITTYILVGRIKRSPFGRLLMSIREDPKAAMSLGKDVASARLKAFWMGAIITSLAGSLWAHHVRNLGPNFYGFEFLVITLVPVILGGLGTHFGAVIGAFVFILVNEETKALAAYAAEEAPGLAAEFSLPALRLVFFGVLVVVFMIMRPEGVLGGRDVSIKWLIQKIKGGNE